MTNVTWYRFICKKKCMFSAALCHEFHNWLFRRRTKKSLSEDNKLGLTTMFSDFNSAEIRSDSLKFVGPSLKRDELGGFFGITYLGSAFIVLNEIRQFRWPWFKRLSLWNKSELISSSLFQYLQLWIIWCFLRWKTKAFFRVLESTREPQSRFMKVRACLTPNWETITWLLLTDRGDVAGQIQGELFRKIGTGLTLILCTSNTSLHLGQKVPMS